ncbi:transmembrane protein, putative (macronuclear) [Tetrahymena thermophila SB210]|uniref:Transmembrane protein, putative n=1 Tax=Tetrahymena thermophila (strain SB210) TaxID=312017 RepID=Q23VD8_TETTS|nr:transmembrane protein, putative [Tetrahymena thermophila SB210]EAS00498.1 transmembrane protein, putative [Tetrahymena thermophila SB210]|eukprot:XP_001020743.1 transmembrane protein, putative [Tetrahymena thermophila SB210]
MRFFAITLLAVIAISSVSAQSQPDIEVEYKTIDCLQNNETYCQNTDKDCLTEQTKIVECEMICVEDNPSSKNDVLSCINFKCTSTNKNIQAWQKAINACLNSNITSFVLVFAIALFALLF